MRVKTSVRRATRRAAIAWLPALALATSAGACDAALTRVPLDQAPAAGAHDASAGNGFDAAPQAWERDAAPSLEAGATPAAPEAGAALAPSLRFPDPLAELPRGETQRALLCGRGLDDVISDLFCAAQEVQIESFAALLAALGFDPTESFGSRGFALSGHSAALSKRSVSAINPRVLFLQLESASEPLLALAFTRGETFVELVARSRTSAELEFYVLAFELGCGTRCAPRDLLTAAVERDWRDVRLYHELDLANTALDCRTCHQPDGPGSRKLLRMQELAVPWTHWLHEQTGGGRALLEDYFAAHGDEVFAGIPGAKIARSHPGLLAAFVSTAGFRVQPNEFPATSIEIEVEASAPGQPADNRQPGRSQAWQAIYQAALRGEAIPVPYHDVKITAADKFARMSAAYAAYRAGALAQHALPDVRDVLPDDPVLLAEIGVLVDERLDDRALLTAACGLCHNLRLDQSQSRARFHTELERLSAEAKRAAVQRLELPGTELGAMPPRRLFELSEAARARLIALLRP